MQKHEREAFLHYVVDYFIRKNTTIGIVLPKETILRQARFKHGINGNYLAVITTENSILLHPMDKEEVFALVEAILTTEFFQ